MYRGDASEFLLRDTKPRVVYAKENIPAHNNDKASFARGDIVVVNDQYPRYKGELQIVLTPFENDGRRNLVGHLYADDLDLLKAVKPWSTFIMKQS